MIITGLQLISRGESGRNIQDQLVAILPPKEKQALVEAIETDSKHNVFHGTDEEKLNKRNILRGIICIMTED